MVTVFSLPENSPFVQQPLVDPYELLHLSHDEELPNEQREDFSVKLNMQNLNSLLSLSLI